LAGLLDQEQIDALSELIPYEASSTADGELTLDFCTYDLRPEPPDDVFRIGLHRWRVKTDPGGRLSWSSRPIAQGLNSPRYSPA
jgi:hypothetical protein